MSSDILASDEIVQQLDNSVRSLVSGWVSLASLQALDTIQDTAIRMTDSSPKNVKQQILNISAKAFNILEGEKVIWNTIPPEEEKERYTWRICYKHVILKHHIHPEKHAA